MNEQVLALGLLLLVTIASVSPILTLLHLWQMKEWRWDRLMDHLKTEGVFASLVSKSRIMIALVFITGIFGIWYLIARGIIQGLFPETLLVVWHVAFVGALIGMSVIQWIVKKQPSPVWTMKARMMFLVSTVLTVIAGFAIWHAVFLPSNIGECCEFEIGIKSLLTIYTPFALPYFAPLFVLLAWLLLRPIDLFLKHRILTRARGVREAHKNLTVIGITGSVGKTTTKELLKHLLEPLGAVATPLHVNTEMGVASWLTTVLAQEPTDSKKILIVEMGAYRGGEIALLCSIAQPTIGVLTFVGRQHSALFGGEMGIARAKSELLAALPKNGRAFVNADSPLIDVIKERAVSDTTYVGTDGRAAVRALDIEETAKGIAFRYNDRLFEVPLAGTHNVTNILLAICVAETLGVSTDNIARQLQSFSAFAHTFQRREENGVVILDNTYNASVESFLAGIDWAERQTANEKVLLCDGIIELGDDEERLHRMVAEKAATVFSKAYVIHGRFLPYFAPAFGNRVMLASRASATLQPGTLLVCMGRMSQKTITTFLPSKST